MENAEKKLFLQKLANEDDNQLVSTLHYFRENGDVSLLPQVLELLTSDRSDDLKNSILELVADIKTQDAAMMAFDFMYHTQNMQIKKAMIATLWQSGQNFSDKAEDIVDLMLLFNEFEPAFDSYTLLENCAENIPQEIASKLFDKIKNAESFADDSLKGIYESAKAHLLKIATGRVEDY